MKVSISCVVSMIVTVTLIKVSDGVQSIEEKNVYVSEMQPLIEERKDLLLERLMKNRIFNDAYSKLTNVRKTAEDLHKRHRRQAEPVPTEPRMMNRRKLRRQRIQAMIAERVKARKAAQNARISAGLPPDPALEPVASKRGPNHNAEPNLGPLDPMGRRNRPKKVITVSGHVMNLEGLPLGDVPPEQTATKAPEPVLSNNGNQRQEIPKEPTLPDVPNMRQNQNNNQVIEQSGRQMTSRRLRNRNNIMGNTQPEIPLDALENLQGALAGEPPTVNKAKTSSTNQSSIYEMQSSLNKVNNVAYNQLSSNSNGANQQKWGSQNYNGNSAQWQSPTVTQTSIASGPAYSDLPFSTDEIMSAQNKANPSNYNTANSINGYDQNQYQSYNYQQQNWNTNYQQPQYTTTPPTWNSQQYQTQYNNGYQANNNVNDYNNYNYGNTNGYNNNNNQYYNYNNQNYDGQNQYYNGQNQNYNGQTYNNQYQNSQSYNYDYNNNNYATGQNTNNGWNNWNTNAGCPDHCQQYGQDQNYSQVNNQSEVTTNEPITSELTTKLPRPSVQGRQGKCQVYKSSDKLGDVRGYQSKKYIDGAKLYVRYFSCPLWEPCVDADMLFTPDGVCMHCPGECVVDGEMYTTGSEFTPLSNPDIRCQCETSEDIVCYDPASNRMENTTFVPLPEGSDKFCS